MHIKSIRCAMYPAVHVFKPSLTEFRAWAKTYRFGNVDHSNLFLRTCSHISLSVLLWCIIAALCTCLIELFSSYRCLVTRGSRLFQMATTCSPGWQQSTAERTRCTTVLATSWRSNFQADILTCRPRWSSPRRVFIQTLTSMATSVWIFWRLINFSVCVFLSLRGYINSLGHFKYRGWFILFVLLTIVSAVNN